MTNAAGKTRFYLRLSEIKQRRDTRCFFSGKFYAITFRLARLHRFFKDGFSASGHAGIPIAS